MKNSWKFGQSCSIDLHGCDHELMKDPAAMKAYVRGLCSEIRMKRYGPTIVERLGKGKYRGYSLMQLIHTSTIIAHFDEKADRAFIDLISVKEYSPRHVAEFSRKFFRARKARIKSFDRI